MSFIAAQNRYRPDIDGLRALAVTVVVLYHAKIPGFPGGFVGVDVFFVISGFLITGILARSFAAGTFSLAEFYERRARRILPALFAMVLGVLAAAPFFIRPWDLAAIGRSVKYVATSTANIDFYQKLGDYSGDDASLTPLLHMWSLSVEEQFYLVTPLLWLLLCKFTRNPSHWLKLFVALALASFAGNLWMLPRDSSSCFFLLPYRAWELAAGGLLALMPLPALRASTSRILGTVGLGMILWATFRFNHDTPFPGPWALLPCLGAVMVIASGLATTPTFPTRILQTRPLVFVGLISYSLYLMHWPVLVFANYREQDLGSELSWWMKAILIVFMFVLGWLSWRFVERPFRHSGLWTRRRIFTFAWIGLAATFGLGYFYQKTPLFLNLLPEEARVMAEAAFSNKEKVKEPLSSPIDQPHRFGSPDVEPDTVLWGDSHAAALSFPLHELALSKNRSFLFYGRSANPPVKGIVCTPGLKGIVKAEYNTEVFDALVKSEKIRNVILVGRWACYTEGHTSAYGPAEKTAVENGFIQLPGNPPPGSEEVRSAFGRAIEDTVKGLVEAGKKVYLVYPVPETAYSIPQVLANEVIEGRDPAKFTVPAQKIYYERTGPIVAILDAAAKREGVIGIRPEEKLIDQGNIRLMNEGKPFYFDDDHLTLDGGRYIMPLFEQIFQ
ncbi:MAG: acyltransferase family protein [Verrucomicrobiales bacterium]